MSDTFAIELKGVTKVFGQIVANKDVNLQVKKGEILAILGENGSGKTTLMNMLSGIYFPDEGQIYVNGEEVVIKILCLVQGNEGSVGWYAVKEHRKVMAYRQSIAFIRYDTRSFQPALSERYISCNAVERKLVAVACTEGVELLCAVKVEEAYTSVFGRL